MVTNTVDGVPAVDDGAGGEDWMVVATVVGGFVSDVSKVVGACVETDISTQLGVVIVDVVVEAVVVGSAIFWGSSVLLFDTVGTGRTGTSSTVVHVTSAGGMVVGL